VEFLEIGLKLQSLTLCMTAEFFSNYGHVGFIGVQRNNQDKLGDLPGLSSRYHVVSIAEILTTLTAVAIQRMRESVPANELTI
jgi:hypothetical protein